MRRARFPIFVLVAGTLIYFAGRAWKPGSTDGSDPAASNGAPHASSSETTKSAEASAGKAADSPGKAAVKAPPQDEWQGFSPDDLKRNAENAQSFLSAKGQTPFNLLAAFTATAGDERYLKQALQRFPNEPAVLYVALGEAMRGAERAALIERFKAADPNNPLPWVFSAAELFEDGRAEEGVAELREALKRPGFYTYFNERAAALREFALQSGLGEYAAESMALFSQRLPHLAAATKASRGLASFVDAQIGNGDNAAIHANVNLLYDLGRMFQTPEAARLLVGQLVGVAMERRALEVASNLRENPLPIAPEPRTAELGQLRGEAKTLAEAAGRVPAEPALWQEYFARFRTDGEIAALRWVKQQPQGVTMGAARAASPVTGAIKAK